MKIIGANLGSVDCELKRLTDYDLTDDTKRVELIKKIENFYLSLSALSNTYVNPMKKDEDNKIVIEKGLVNHRCSSNISNLRTISNYGVLASEWFGILESENEGCFCAFVSRMKGTSYKLRGDLCEDDYSRLNIGDNVLLFFDSENEVMKNLLRLDYFEYEDIKKKNPDNLSEIYSQEEIEIFDELIEKLSPSGTNMRCDFDNKTNYWSAVIGGIPSFLVNGVCIKNNNYTDSELDEIRNLFPNACIFDSKRTILRERINEEEIYINTK